MREERRERAGASESARDEIGFGSSESGSGTGKSVDKRWMRDRALEMDSHHECIGSLLLLLVVLLSLVVVMAVLPLWFWWCWLPFRWLGFWEEEEVVEEEEGDPPGMWWRKSIFESSCDSSPVAGEGEDGGHEQRVSCPLGSDLSYVA